MSTSVKVMPMLWDDIRSLGSDSSLPGLCFRSRALPPLTGVFKVRNDLFILYGQSGTVLVCEGMNKWYHINVDSKYNIEDLWADDLDNIYAVIHQTTMGCIGIMRFDGSRWWGQPSPPYKRLRIAAKDRTKLYIAASVGMDNVYEKTGALFVLENGSCHELKIFPNRLFTDIFQNDRGEIYIAGYHQKKYFGYVYLYDTCPWHGGKVSKYQSDFVFLNRVWGIGSGMWAVGTMGTIASLDNGRWTSNNDWSVVDGTSRGSPNDPEFTGISATNPDNVVFSGNLAERGVLIDSAYGQHDLGSYSRAANLGSVVHMNQDTLMVVGNHFHNMKPGRGQVFIVDAPTPPAEKENSGQE